VIVVYSLTLVSFAFGFPLALVAGLPLLNWPFGSQTSPNANQTKITVLIAHNNGAFYNFTGSFFARTEETGTRSNHLTVLPAASHPDQPELDVWSSTAAVSGQKSKFQTQVSSELNHDKSSCSRWPVAVDSACGDFSWTGNGRVKTASQVCQMVTSQPGLGPWKHRAQWSLTQGVLSAFRAEWRQSDKEFTMITAIFPHPDPERPERSFVRPDC